MKLKQIPRIISLALALCGGVSLVACRAAPPYTILETKEHDASLYTQGLIVDGDDLIESGGQYGKSRLVRYNAESGQVSQSARLPATIFAEGIHLLSGSIWLLTWQENCVYRIDAKTFSIRQKFPVQTEGWGLTHNGQHFIQSDGSDTLFFRNSSTFAVEKTISVRDGERACYNLNELEFAKELVWANVYMTSTILAIDPNSGEVVLSLDLSDIAARHKDSDPGHVLNGIAYDPARDAFWVTGKCWNKRYLIQIQP